MSADILCVISCWTMNPEMKLMRIPCPGVKLDFPFNPGVKIDGRNMHPVCEGRNMHPVCEGRNMHPVCEGRNMHHDCEGTLKLMMMTNCILLDKILKVKTNCILLDKILKVKTNCILLDKIPKINLYPVAGVVLGEIPYPGVILD